MCCKRLYLHSFGSDTSADRNSLCAEDKGALLICARVCGSGELWNWSSLGEYHHGGEEGKRERKSKHITKQPSLLQVCVSFYHSQIILSVMDKNDKYSSCQNLVINLHVYIAASSSFSGYIFRGAANATYQ